MKFINKDGKIEEGIPLTEQQVRWRKNLVEYFHLEACNGSYHAYYESSPRKCEKLANACVTGKISAAANRAEPLPEDEHPSPNPTGVEA